ncbi:MAG TPA: hypothetical protein VFA82_06540 [Gaiellaceae bacterium]|nr:hypothetical protein [Gaiellaceae bacterium]
MTSLLQTGSIITLGTAVLLVFTLVSIVGRVSRSRRRRVTSSPTVYRTYPVYRSAPLR